MDQASPAGALIVNAATALAACGIGLWLRPWRAVGPGGPPWPWLALWVAMPLLWGLDGYGGTPLVQPLSCASLLVLLAGWPLAVLAMVPVAVVTVWASPMDALEGVHRYVWLGVMPATLALVIGAALRRWLPHHLFVYILGRGYLGTLVAAAVAGVVSLALRGPPVGTTPGDLLVARLLAAFGEAFLTGMFTAILVAFRPQWLATYADSLYLPPAPRP